MVSSKSSKEEYKNASGNAAVPDVLEDLLRVLVILHHFAGHRHLFDALPSLKKT